MENKQKIMVQFDFPEMTSESYNQIWQELRAAGFENPKGLLHHAGAPAEKGLKVVDIWENAEKFKEFGKTLMPILNKHGIKEANPIILPLQYEYKGI